MDLAGELNRLAGIAVVDRIGAAGAANLWAGTTGLELVGALNAKAGLPVNGTSLELNGILKRLGFDLDGNGALVGAADGTTNLSNTLRLGGIPLSYFSTPDTPAASLLYGNVLSPNQTSLETDTTGWAASTNATIAQSAAQFETGTKSLAITSVAAGDFQAATPADGSLRAWASKSYTARASFRAATTARTVEIGIYWYDVSLVLISTSLSTGAADTTTGWTAQTVTATAPANAASMRIVAKIYAAAAGGEVQYVDNIAVFPTTQEVEFVAKLAPVYWANPMSKAQGIWSKWDATGAGQFSYYFLLNATGNVAIGLGTFDGTAANTVFSSSSVVAPFSPGQAGWIKATWRASDSRVQFFTSTYGGNDEAGVSWTQLGADQGIGYTHIYDGTQQLILGAGSPGGTERLNGHLYYASIKNAIGGNNVVTFDASAVAVRGDRNPTSVTTLGTNILNANQAGLETSLSWGSSGCTVARSNLYHHTGSWSLEMTYVGAGEALAVPNPDLAVIVPGQTYTISGWFFNPPGNAVRDVRLIAQFYQTLGAGFVTSAAGPTVTLTPGVWTFLTADFTAPALSSVLRAMPAQRNGGNAWIAGEKLYVDDFYYGPSTTLTASGTDWWWGTYSGTQRFTRSLRLPGYSPNYISTPDTAALSIVGDLDIRILARLDVWISPVAEQEFLSKYNSTGNQRSWRLYSPAGGTGFIFAWSSDGTLGAVGSVSISGLTYAPGSLHWLRATLDVDAGASNKTAVLYDSTDGVTWNTLVTSTTANITSIFDSTAPLEVGSFAGGGSGNLLGNVYYAEVRNGLAGTVVAAFDPMRIRPTGPQTPTTVGNPGSNGGTWTINGSAWAWDTA